jgi:hypothetical protein
MVSALELGEGHVSTIVSVWAAVCLAVVVALTAFATRLGRPRAAAWLVVIGLVVLVLEEPALTTWLAIGRPGSDGDGMAGLITPMARAHVLDAGVFGVASAGLLGWVALTAFRRGERWARHVLRWALVVVAATEVASGLLVFSRGLPLPGPGGTAGHTGFGWQPVAVGLVAWAIGLRLAPRPRPAGSAAEPPSAMTAGTGG